MIRLFASDMDGTLLNDKGYISDRTINAVKKLQKHGIHFIVNTGRDYHAAKRELDAASLSCDMICHSGACTYDVHGNGFHIASLPKSIAKQILTVFERHGAFADIATEYGKTSITDKNTLLSYYKNEVFPAVEQEGIVYFRTWHDFAMMVSKVRFFEGKESLLGCETPIYKISTTFFDQDKINALKDDIHGIDQLHAVSTSKNDLEITHVNAQTGTALLRYAQTKKITPSQILAVGDSGNDLSMLSLDLGVTAAMANASAAVKDVCSVIAPSNDQDGVVFLIEDILEQNELAARVRRSFCLALDYSKI